MTDKHNQLLYGCYLTGQISAAQWQLHLSEAAGLREYVEIEDERLRLFLLKAETDRRDASDLGSPAPKPKPRLGARQRAFDEYHRCTRGALATVRTAEHDAFKAGWNARKQFDYEAALACTAAATADAWRDKL